MAKAKILVVEDDNIVRLDIQSRLQAMGYDVPVTASSGRDAISKATQMRPDLVLMDIKLKDEMDGVEAAKHIQARIDIPVIYLTAYADEETVQRAKITGPFAYILKPFKEREFQTTLEMALYRHRMERRLKESERQLATTLKSIGDAVVATDANGCIQFMNPVAEALTGWQQAEALDKELKKVVKIFDGDTGSPCEGLFLRLLQEDAPFEPGEKNLLVAKDGSEILVDDNAAPIIDDQGNISGIVLVFRDITGRKQAEEALWKAHDELKTRVAERTTELSTANQQLQLEIAEHQRTEAALRRYADDQAVLYAVTSTVATSLDPDQLFSNVLDIVLPALGADAGWITLPGSSLDAPPNVAAWTNVPEPYRKARHSRPLRGCPACTALLTRDGGLAEPMSMADCSCVAPEILVNADLRTHLGIPITGGGRARGILELAWLGPYRCSESDSRLLMTIGQQVGVALHNAQLYRAARQRDQLQVLNELDQALSATLDPKEVAEICLQHVATALEAPSSALFLYTPPLDELLERLLTLRYGWMKLSLSEQEVERLQALLEQWRAHPETAPLSNDELNALIDSIDNPIMQIMDSSNNLIIPIWGKAELIAVLALVGRTADQPYSDEERSLAQAAARRAGQALENTRLFHASQERATRLATLNSISAAAFSSLELNTALRQSIEQTCQALDAAEGSILLRDPNTEEMFFAVTLNDASEDLHSQRLAPGQGIAGWAVQHGQPLRVNDVRADPRWDPSVDAAIGFETHSLLCAPLVHRDEIIGVIEIVNKRQGDFTEEDLGLLVAVASIVAAALENARLYTAMRSYTDRMVHLHQIGQTLTSTLDYDTVVLAAVSQVQRLFNAAGAALLETDPQTGELCYASALIGEEPIEIPLRLKPGEGLAGWALENRQPVLVEDAQQDPRHSERVNQHIQIERHALMAVPLLTQDRDTGVIEVVSSAAEVYTHDELNTLQAIATTLAVALENAQLYAEQKQLLHERKQAQAQLIHSEKMTALGRLTASIAHEINNPLQAVQGCLTLTEEELAGERRQDKVGRYLGIVGSEIQRIAAIVQRMRDFYRPAQEGLVSTDLNGVIESVLELVNKQLQHSSVTVERALGDQLPHIQANPDHLKQVFLNLVLNAVDAMPQGGTLHISTALDQIQLNGGQPQPAAYINLRDSGVGMSAETLSRLFEPFFTTKVEGTGLGLSISYGIIESHNGQISVDSQLGKGTTVEILLPLEQLQE
jgi:PAS domain S-box-containing protein